MGVIVLLIWWGALELFGDFAYSVHSKIAPMSRQQFDIIHYVGMVITWAIRSLTKPTEYAEKNQKTM